MHINNIFISKIIILPNRPVNLLLRKYSSRIHRQQLHNLPFLRGQLDRFSLLLHIHIFRINHKLMHLQNRRFLLLLCAGAGILSSPAYGSLNPGQQLDHGERLGQIIIRPKA
ncbi:hypothetical protein D3C78_1481330 [compost metagenome]